MVEFLIQQKTVGFYDFDLKNAEYFEVNKKIFLRVVPEFNMLFKVLYQKLTLRKWPMMNQSHIKITKEVNMVHVSHDKNVHIVRIYCLDFLDMNIERVM